MILPLTGAPLVPLTALLGLDLLTWVAIALLFAGVVGSLVPLVPGALLSLAGVYLHWWATDYSEPGLFALGILTSLGVVTVLVDWLAGALSARAGGASTRTMVVAGLAGFLLFFVAGPLGVLAGVAGTVFLSEYLDHEDARQAARTAGYATVGVLASNVAQALLTLAMLVGFLLVLLL